MYRGTDRFRYNKLYLLDSNFGGFAGGAVVKNLPVNAGDTRDRCSILRLGRVSEVGNGNSLQYSCLKNSMNRGRWWATFLGVTKHEIQLNAHTHFIYIIHLII